DYTVAISQSGFKSFSKTLTVPAGAPTTLDVTLELQTVSQQVEVKDESTALSTETARAPDQTVTQQELVSLPTQLQKIREVLPVTAGVIRTIDGKLRLKGADENQGLLLVNSARTTDPVTGSFAVPVPAAAVESFGVYKTPYNAGSGSFSGGL